MKKKRSFKSKCKAFFKKIGNFFVELKNRFFKLKKSVRIIIYVWIAVLLVILLLIMGANINNKKINEHKELEKTISDAALTYATKIDFIGTNSNKLRLNLDMLVDFGYITEDEITDKSCNGFALVYYIESEGRNTASAYINCKHYTTEEYFLYYDQ